MPISGYFGGKGTAVMKSMKDRYGNKEGESAFYGTANKLHQLPASKLKKSMKSAMQMSKRNKRPNVNLGG
jgi:hypothetical protein